MLPSKNFKNHSWLSAFAITGTCYLFNVYVGNSVSVPIFKVNLEDCKRKCVMIETGNYWEVSNIVLDQIKGPNYNQNKQVQNEFLIK